MSEVKNGPEEFPEELDIDDSENELSDEEVDDEQDDDPDELVEEKKDDDE